MPTTVHFNIPVKDVNRAKKFYNELFGWEIERVLGLMEYYNITTYDDKGNTSFGDGMGESQEQDDQITNYIDVPLIDEYVTKVQQLGGKIIMPKTIIPGFGNLAVCLDSENNKFGFWETDEKATQQLITYFQFFKTRKPTIN